MAAKQTIIVSATGEGDYTTIGEAIKNAQPDSCILVRPGLYKEGLIIDKQLEIIGDGSVADIVIESTDSSCIIMQTDNAVVRGLTLRGRGAVKKKNFYAVKIPQGKLVLEDCDITSDSLPCIGIHGATANPLIRRCQIHHGKRSGVFVYDNGQGTVEDCDIFSNGWDPLFFDGEVNIKQGSNPIIRRCQIHDGKGNGVYVYEYGQGTVEDCKIFANTYAGVAIEQGSNPMIRRCQINRNGYQAVSVYKNSAGSVENCNLTDNTHGAWDIKPGCSVYRSDNIED
ncbi:MAG: right-handed parallel beta-helix repeat-containing protein [Crinalium sp.]